METCKNKEELLKKIISSDSGVFAFIGENAVGKTSFLNKLFDSLPKNIKKLFLRSEIEIIKEVGKGTKTYLSFVDNLINLINDIHGEIVFSTNEIDKINNIKNIINNSFLNEDKYFKKEFMNCFNIIDSLKKEKIIETNKINKPFYSSGEGIYSLLMILNNLLVNVDKNNFEICLIIDEPEKFLHPTLMKKVINILINLSTNYGVKIVFSSHSPIFLNILFLKLLHKNYNLLFLYKFLRNDKFYEIDKKVIFSQNVNIRQRKLICESLFAENIVLVEGLKDFEYASQITENLFENHYFTIIDCGGWTDVININDLILKSTSNHLQCFSFIDSDGMKREDKFINIKNYKYFYIFEKDIEQEMCDKFQTKNNTSIYKFDNIKKTKNFDSIKEKLTQYIKRELD